VCGNFGIVSTDCISCGSDKISKINMPYAAKLLIQELNTMGIKTFFKAKS
jgi:DNA-directed RNA polymerase beta subunit